MGGIVGIFNKIKDNLVKKSYITYENSTQEGAEKESSLH
jgi:hypothetical protein